MVVRAVILKDFLPGLTFRSLQDFAEWPFYVESAPWIFLHYIETC